nr:MAG TPA: hypothetical protein [Caudoviricetes sp.]
MVIMTTQTIKATITIFVTVDVYLRPAFGRYKGWS